ncbi:MAG TPA: Uma2 family endonuclease [Thermoanaerobaculia bacterium]|nr:Uma2 family endonuclease [Thermoanaerobaculia bacterium]
MTERAKRGADYRDVIAAPEDRIAEIVSGDLYLSPRPSLRHANATSVLGSDLNAAFHRGRRGPGGWWILDEPELHLEGDVLVPDIAGWRRERLPTLPEGSGVEIAPDWLCEVLSPSTERFDRLRKLPRYAAAGVAHLWLVDPSARRLEVFGRLEREWILLERYAGEATVSAPPFEDVPIDLTPVWV